MPHCVKPEIITNHLCQITLNRTWSHNFEKCCKFSSCINQNHTKINHVKRDLPVLGYYFLCLKTYWKYFGSAHRHMVVCQSFVIKSKEVSWQTKYFHCTFVRWCSLTSQSCLFAIRCRFADVSVPSWSRGSCRGGNTLLCRLSLLFQASLPWS